MIPSGNSRYEDYRNQLSVTATGLTVIPKKDQVNNRALQQ